jgi:hypothetical protein
MVKEAQEQTANVLSIRKAFVKSMWERLKSPVQLLKNYANVFNNPDFRLKLEERPKAYQDIVDSAKQIGSLINRFVLSFFVFTTDRTVMNKELLFAKDKIFYAEHLAKHMKRFYIIKFKRDVYSFVHRASSLLCKSSSYSRVSISASKNNLFTVGKPQH